MYTVGNRGTEGDDEEKPGQGTGQETSYILSPGPLGQNGEIS